MLETNNILYWIIIGGIAGGLAKLVMPGKDPGGIIVTILLGVAGAILMGFLAGIFGLRGDGAGFISAFVGAVVLLLLYRVFVGRRTRT